MWRPSFRGGRAEAQRLQRGLALDAGAGIAAEAVAAADLPVGQGAASLRRLRRWSDRAAAYDGSWRRAESDWSRRERADVLRERAPVQRLVAELDVKIARRAEEIDARGAERRRHIGLREIKQAGAGLRRIGDGDVEPAVRSLHGDRGDRRGRWCRRARIDAGTLARGVHRRHNARQRLIQIRIAILYWCELG